MLKWFLSPEGEKLEVNECIEKGLLSDYYPTPYLKMCAEQREWKGIPSTTQLINGARQEFLKIYTDYAVSPKDMAFMLLGTRVHKRLEDLTPIGSFAELSIPIGEDEISGIADLLEQQPNGEWWLVDHKTWGSYKVMLGLGFVKKKRPMLDDNGNPVLYKRGGKGYVAGDPRMEDYYTQDPAAVDMYVVELQLNRYRYVIESYFGIVISKLKVFAIVRDGGTTTAKGRGIVDNTYYIDVKMLDNEDVKKYYSDKRRMLLDHIEEVEERLKEDFGLNNKLPEIEFDIIKDYAPEPCTEKESWNGRRCNGYCPVAETCKKLGCPYIKEENV